MPTRARYEKPDLYAAAAVCTKVRSYLVTLRYLKAAKRRSDPLKRFVLRPLRSRAALSR
jgi:hypothetical protein